jgi:hypothetical protein
LLSPQVLTSGQSWVGAQLAMTTMSHKAVLKRLEHLSPDHRIGISCESSRGQRLLASLKGECLMLVFAMCFTVAPLKVYVLVKRQP